MLIGSKRPGGIHSAYADSQNRYTYAMTKKAKRERLHKLDVDKATKKILAIIG